MTPEKILGAIAQRLEDDGDWDPDTLDFIAELLIDEGYAWSNKHGLFRAVPR